MSPFRHRPKRQGRCDERGYHGQRAPAADGDVLLRIENLVKYFPVQSASLFRRDREVVHAVDGVSLEVRRGETLGLVGETGCGKSTLARCILRLYQLTSGRITFDGQDISTLKPRQMRPLRREMQMIFQDPYGSLNPRRRVGSIIGDPFAIHKTATRRWSASAGFRKLMELVGLNPEHYNRFPAEFSGGQRQRIGVARALAFRPKLIVCDEPVSALDVSIQAQIINLLADLQSELGPDLHLHRARPVRGPARERPGGGHVPGQDRRARAGRRSLRRTRGTPTRTRCCPPCPVPDPDKAGQRERIILVGDVPSPDQPAVGLPVPPALPQGRPDLRGRTIRCSSPGSATPRTTRPPATSRWKTGRTSPSPGPPSPPKTA